MKSKRLLLTLLMALLVPWAANAQQTVQIGNGTATTNQVPIGTYYNYSITEQLYTAEEIGMAGSISSISFYYMGIAAKDLPIAVYMMNTDAANLSTGISLADANEVFNGTLSVPATAGWVTINFDSPFEYDGNSNLLIGINKGYVYYFNGQSWQGTSVSNMARYSQNDNSAYATSTVPSNAASVRPNIQLEIAPSGGMTCDKPETLTAMASDNPSYPATHAILLQWEGGSGTYNVQIKKASQSADEWATKAAYFTENALLIHSLDAGTAYNARVQSVCYDNEGGIDPEIPDFLNREEFTSGWRSVDFTTACEAITTFPWSENFESYSASSSGVTFNAPCWVNEHISGSGSYFFEVYSGTNGTNSTKQLRLRDMSSGTMTKLMLPEMTLPTDNYLFSIDVYRNASGSSYTSEGVRVFVSADGEIEGATELAFLYRNFTQTDGNLIPAESAVGWYTYELPIPMSGTCYIILRGESQYGSHTYMDNFIVKEAPACPKPTGVTVSDVTAHGATVAWTSDASAWQIQLGEETAIDVTEPTYTFTGLAPETPFSVKVRANCDGAYSEWTAPVSFTTSVACPVPTQILVSDITAYTAVVSWVSEAERFSLQLGENVFENVTSPYTLTDLTPNTSYTVKVKAICGGEDGESAWSNGTSFMTAEICPEGMVCIGTGTATSTYMPINNYYNYSLTEQIYTAAEIGQAGAILSIEFFKAATIEAVKDLNIYMVATNKDEFDSTTDWITVTASDLVYSGTVTFVDNDWTTIELDNPFIYDGTSNVCVVVDNNTGSYKSNTNFRTFNDVKNRTLYYQNDGTNPDPLNPTITASGKTATKNRIRLAIGEPPACPKPTGLTASDVTAHEATITWTSDASAWQIQLGEETAIDVTEPTYTFTGLAPETPYSVKVRANCDGTYSDWTTAVSFTTTIACPVPTALAAAVEGNTATITWNGQATAYNIDINGTVTENVTSPYVLRGDLSTTYTVKVQAVCGDEDGNSEWTSPVSFTTDMCLAEDMCQIAFVLNDSYGDGWNGNAIKVVDVLTNTVLGQFTISNGSSATHILNVCDGRAIQFVWVSGSYADETSYVVYNHLEEVIFEGSDAMSAPVNYTVNCTVPACPKPTGLSVNYNGGNTAIVTWTGEAEAFSIDVNGTVTEGVTSPYTLEGLELATTYNVMVQAVCSAEDSEWTNPVSFTTDLCMPENQCEITFELTDSYGDGWNGAYIEVVDVTTETVLGQFTNTSEAEGGEAQIYTLAVCDGRAIQFVWHSGSYDNECSYVVTDLNGEEIFSGSDAMSAPINYTVNCTVITCKKPKDLAAFDIDKTSVVLSWTPGSEDQNAWRICYNDGEEDHFKNVTTIPYTLNGLTPETEYTVKVRANCGDGDYSNWSDEISFTTAEACPAAIFNFAASNVTVHNALLSWSGEFESYQVQYRKNTETEWSDAISTNEAAIALSDLEAYTEYLYEVRGYCSDVDVYSEWVNGIYFTTQSICEAPQNLYAVPGTDNATISWTGYQTEYTVAFGSTVETVYGTTYTIEGLESSTEYTVTVTGVGTECGEYQSATLEFTTGTGWNDPNAWSEPGVLNDGTVVVIEPGEEPTEIPEDITIGDGSYIVIEPGAEVIYSGEDPIPVVITFDDDDDDDEGEPGGRCRDELPGGYKLIAPPVYTSATQQYVTVESAHLMDLPDDYYAYDLYSFDLDYPQAEWRNYKADQDNFNLNWKQGYLYYGKAYSEISWSGLMVATTNNSVEIDLDYNEANTNFPGANLIGNPFTVKGYPNKEFYVLNSDGNEVISASNNYVKAARGFFVLAEGPGETCTVYTEAPVTLQSLNIALSQDCSLIDAAAIRFNDTKGLAKIQLNPNHTKIYMPFEGKDYAILQGEGLGEMPINIEVEENGTYTLNFASKEVSFSYLHLIDNLTGVETNLLANSNYSFEAKTTDYASRFRLVYATGSSVDGDSFGFINSMGNLSIYGIEGVATLQVMDITGRILSSETFSGSYERKLNVAPGVYMLRLVNGNDVKVQKIVVK